MKAAAVVVGVVIMAVPTVAGALFALNPLLPRKKDDAGSDDGFRRVGKLSQLTPGGPPVLIPITGVKRDAWTTYPEASLGAVYVRQLADGKLAALNARCPHLGCMVSLRAGETVEFKCPCHSSAFTLDGARGNDIPPRDMDSLEVEVRNTDEIWVKFQNFRAGRAEKEAIA